MAADTNQAMLLAQGIQFSVFARAFPVLRHDALKPIANAKMAAAMMQRGAGEDVAYCENRNQQLLSDVDFMLDEAVDSVRLLADWLTDSGRSVDVCALVRECAKLLFTDLLLSGKKVVVGDLDGLPHVPEYTGRYVVLAWLLCMVEAAPDGSELTISSAAHRLHARLDAAAGGAIIRPSASNSAPLLSLEAVQTLASYRGWHAERQQEGIWHLDLPISAKDRQGIAVNRAA